MVQTGTIGFRVYHYLLVINCTRGRISHRLREVAFDMFNVAIFGYPLRFTPVGWLGYNMA